MFCYDLRAQMHFGLVGGVLCRTLSSVLGHSVVSFLSIVNVSYQCTIKDQYTENCLPHMTQSIRSPVEHLETGTIA